MKRHIVAIALGSLFALPAFATDGEIDHAWVQAAPRTNLSREQVRAGVVARQRAGDYFIANTGLKAYQMWPSLYPQPAVVAGKTRAQVLAELERAERSGDFVVDGELGLKASQVFPNAYPRQILAAGEGKSRL
jgi:hypothetical protein